MDDSNIEDMKKQLQNAMQQRDKERYDGIKSALDKIVGGLEKNVDLNNSQTQLNNQNVSQMTDLQNNVVDMMQHTDLPTG